MSRSIIISCNFIELHLRCELLTLDSPWLATVASQGRESILKALERALAVIAGGYYEMFVKVWFDREREAW